MESNTFYDIYLEELKKPPAGHAGGGSGASEKTDGGGQDRGFPSDGS